MQHIHECPRCGNTFLESEFETQWCNSSHDKTCYKCNNELNPEDTDNNG